MKLFGPPGIGKLESGGDVAALIEALRGEDPRRRLQAAEALGRLGDAQAGNPLIEALTDPGVRDVAAASLLMMAPRVMDVLVMTLRNANPWVPGAGADPAVRVQVADILGYSGDERAFEPLVGALEDVDEVATAAVRALGHLGDARALGPLSAALPRHGVVAVDALVDLGDPGATGAVVEWVMPFSKVSGQPDEAAAAIRALGRLGPPDVVHPFIRRIASRFPGPGTPNGDVIQAAVGEAEDSLAAHR